MHAFSDTNDELDVVRNFLHDTFANNIAFPGLYAKSYSDFVSHFFKERNTDCDCNVDAQRWCHSFSVGYGYRIGYSVIGHDSNSHCISHKNSISYLDALEFSKSLSAGYSQRHGNELGGNYALWVSHTVADDLSDDAAHAIAVAFSVPGPDDVGYALVFASSVAQPAAFAVRGADRIAVTDAQPVAGAVIVTAADTIEHTDEVLSADAIAGAIDDAYSFAHGEPGSIPGSVANRLRIPCALHASSLGCLRNRNSLVV